MSRIPNIKLNIKELDNILKEELSSGGEAVICRGSKANTLYKIFADSSYQRYSDAIGIPFSLSTIEMSDNKFKKIQKLYQMSLKNSVRPISTLSVKGRLIGYEMTYDKDDKALVDQSLSTEELIYFLKQSRDVLEYYAKNDITYGDINTRNILVNKKTGTIKFCDMDNIRLGEYPIDVMGRDLYIYSIIRGLDQKTDAYMHNIMSLKSLVQDEPLISLEPVARLAKRDFSSVLSSSAQKTLESMEEPANFNGEYIIQYAKK
ncbi:MAG: hypothetical protein PUC82_00055 [bacterium]|nr:hypothetical protein [bacterium]